jgi:hypothetical protein
MNLKDKLISAATRFDERNSRRRGWNPYALAQYFAAIDGICNAVDNGMSVESAIARFTNDRFQDVLLKAAGMERRSA